jgi:hypothetical protein
LTGDGVSDIFNLDGLEFAGSARIWRDLKLDTIPNVQTPLIGNRTVMNEQSGVSDVLLDNPPALVAFGDDAALKHDFILHDYHFSPRSVMMAVPSFASDHDGGHESPSRKDDGCVAQK